ncbi:MAG: DUF4954 family protein [Planctomycetota bacterium]|jgi:hypothetical protein
MAELTILPTQALGYGFIPAEHLPKGKNEYHLRNRQVGRPADHWRHLHAEELEQLIKNGNTSENWDDVRVAEGFNPMLVRGCQFSGLVRIGRIREVSLEMHDLTIPVGLVNSHLVACDIGDDVVVRNVRYMARYIVGDNAMLLNIDELQATDHAKFGNGIVKDGEAESVRIWLDLINEAGGRSVVPFDGMIPADAYLWAAYPQDQALMARFKEITQAQFDSQRGFYGTIGATSVIKNSRIIKDVNVGPRAYIKGANKLKNLTVNSSEDEPTQIGEGVELVNGIIGRGCHVFYGCKAVRFVMGNNSNLKYGARLIHSVLGENSTVSCCELLHNLIFPAHEQHHNNSFLTSSLVKGQSNIAAGATVGSNHNSRANDGEIHAGRGFWPGLCVTLKHSCRFASFMLLSKGDYPAELNIPLPFSLLNDDRTIGRLVVMPAFWWMYNMYALARNSWKFRSRDKRKIPTQKIEFDALAPDTVEEIFEAMRLLEIWTAKARLRADGKCPDQRRDGDLAKLGRKLLTDKADLVSGLDVLGENMECSGREVVIIKVRRAYQAYREMVHYYAVKNLLDYLAARPAAKRATMNRALAGRRQRRWVNVGGQLIPAPDLQKLLTAVKTGKLNTWPAIHGAYDALWEGYPLAKQSHALASLRDLLGVDRLTRAVWAAALAEAVRIQDYICEQVYLSRKKDYDNPFRQATFANAEEMKAVVGTVEDNSFVKQTREETKAFKKRIRSARRRT